MLCAPAASVKEERAEPEQKRGAESRQPNLRELRQPIVARADADAVPSGEIDLRGEEGERGREHGERSEDAGSALEARKTQDGGHQGR